MSVEADKIVCDGKVQCRRFVFVKWDGSGGAGNYRTDALGGFA